MKNELKDINEKYTYSEYFKVKIDQLIERHAFTCVVYGDKVFDIERYKKFRNGDLFSFKPVPRDAEYDITFDADCIIVQQLVKSILCGDNLGVPIFSALGFCDEDIINSSHKKINHMAKIPDDVPVLSFNMDDNFNLEALLTDMISQPFVAMATRSSVESTTYEAKCAIIQISDGEAFLIVA